jgi:uncharacterized protein
VEIVGLILMVLVMLVAGLVGVALTILTFPGVWLTLLVALGLQLIWGPVYSWYTLGVCVGLAFLAEVFEFVASAAGATQSGGGRSGAIGAIAGSTIGALGGTFLLPIPVVGTIAGAVIGAVLGAVAGERGVSGRPWGESMRIGVGAAKGRLLATVVKSAVAALVAVVLLAGVIVPGPHGDVLEPPPPLELPEPSGN